MKYKARKNLFLGFSIALCAAGLGTFICMLIIMLDGTTIYYLSSKIFFMLKSTNANDIKTITTILKILISLYTAISLINMGVGAYNIYCYTLTETNFYIKRTLLLTLSAITIFGKVFIGLGLLLSLIIKDKENGKNNKYHNIKQYAHLEKLKNANKITQEEFEAELNIILAEFDNEPVENVNKNSSVEENIKTEISADNIMNDTEKETEITTKK